MRTARTIALSALALATPLAAGQTSFLLNFGFTDVPVELEAEQGAPFPVVVSGGPGADVFNTAGNVSLTEFGQSGMTPVMSTTLDFAPASFDPAGPGITFAYFNDPIDETVTGTLTITDVDGDRIIAGFAGESSGAFLPFLINANINEFDFIASGDGTNDSTFDDADGNAFRINNLAVPDEAPAVGTVQFTTTIFPVGSGVSLVQGRIVLVPTPATAIAIAAPLGMLAARRRR